MTLSDAGMALLLGGAALLAAGEIGQRRRVRVVGLMALLAGCATTVIDLLTGLLSAGV